MKAKENAFLIFTALLMVVGIYFLGYRVVRTEFSLVLSLYSSLFGLMIFWFFYSKKRTVDWKAVFLVGFILRLVLFPSIPLWSEDFARFLWDGELLNLGFNPYLNTPNQWVQLHSEDFSAYLALLYDRMNSPGYYSVYTPFNQFFFWLGAKLGGGSLIPGLLVLKGILIIGEIAVFFLLKSLLIRFGIGSQKLIFYWLNPFVILEVIGNLHFEGLVLLFLLAVLFGLERKHRLVSASFLAFAVGLKLVPLILAPGFLRIRSKQPWFWMGLGVISLVLFLPLLIDQSWRNFFQSLGLYQGKFEFNASIYYLGREVGYWIEGYNTIAYLTKGLSALTLLLILFLAFKKKINQTKDWIELWIGCYWIYLLLQPVVHPWYLIPGLGLSILTKKIGFLVWSLAVILSYQAYGNHCNVEYPIVLVLEYSLVCVGLIYDYRQHYFTFPIKLLKK